jgi:hypothetical protein
VPWSLEHYLKSDGTVVDRLLKGKTDTRERLLKLDDQLHKLSEKVAGTNGQNGQNQA